MQQGVLTRAAAFKASLLYANVSPTCKWILRVIGKFHEVTPWVNSQPVVAPYRGLRYQSLHRVCVLRIQLDPRGTFCKFEPYFERTIAKYFTMTAPWGYSVSSVCRCRELSPSMITLHLMPLVCHAAT